MRKLTILAALLVVASAHAQSLDDVVSNVVKEYGGKAAWSKVTSLRETGTVVPVMRKGDGKLTRTWSGPGKLNVEIVYPAETEVRIVDGDHGTRNGKDVTGPLLDSMKLQAARLELPMLLVTKRAALKDLGTKDDIRAVEITLSDTLARFQRDLRLEQQWAVDGTHYARTANHWLRNQDANHAQVLNILSAAYGERSGALWLQRWRLFWIACAETFGYADGQEWLVAHYRFARDA